MNNPRDIQPPRGMRDFPPEAEILRRNIFERIEKIFQKYGFDPIETPIVEMWNVLSGKYGEEAEKRLIWRFKLPYSDKEFGLRYDLTVPLARYVARFRPKLPFKRYHIGRVYRYEEPQKGRYREFWQCDVDVVGSDSPLADAEILNIIIDVFDEFGFENYIVRLNDRRLLKGIFERSLGIDDDKVILRIFRTVDKLDRIGKEGVMEELKKMGLEESTLGQIENVLDTTNYSNEEIIEFLDRYRDIKEVDTAVETLTNIIDYVNKKSVIKLDLSMVRGLDYYTGMIYEAVVKKPKIGSLSGGGRYDNLIGMFVNEKIPAVGGSIGVERLIDAGLELGLFTLRRKTLTNIGIIYTEGVDLKDVLRIAAIIREGNIKTYVSFKSFKNILKGIKELDKRGIRYALIIGRKEISSEKLTLQDLYTRERFKVPLGQLVDRIKDIIKG